MRKVKFYWHPNYPEVLYCLTKKGFFCLSDRKKIVNPEDGKVSSGGMEWGKTYWGYTERALKTNRFEFIGEL